MRTTRRTFVRRVVAGSIAINSVGVASAGDRASFIATIDRGTTRDRIEAAGFAVSNTLADGSVALVTGPNDEEALSDVPGVTSVSRDVRVHRSGPTIEESVDEPVDEPLYPLQWDKQRTGVADAQDTTTGDGARLAIVDTGIDGDHPDLAENVDEDLGGLVSGGEVRDGGGDVHGHGTHVAGVAAAARNGDGVVGTAPDAELVSLRVYTLTDDGGLSTSLGDILLALDYASEIDSDAVNLSLATTPLPPQANAGGIRAAFQRVIHSVTRDGTVVVAAAGNQGEDLQRGGSFVIPTSAAGAIAVGATGPNDERAFYSNYGTNEIDVAAPGGGYETAAKTFAEDGVGWPYPTNLVLSTAPPEMYGTPYAYMGGTSMAAPQVTGTVGLLRQIAPSANVNRIERAIMHAAEGARGRSSSDLGAGRIDVRAALDLL